MLPDDHPDRIQIAFDDHRLVNNAGLILPATLALHLGLPQQYHPGGSDRKSGVPFGHRSGAAWGRVATRGQVGLGSYR